MKRFAGLLVAGLIVVGSTVGCFAKYVGANPTATSSTVYSWVIANSQLVGTMRVFTCPI